MKMLKKMFIFATEGIFVGRNFSKRDFACKPVLGDENIQRICMRLTQNVIQSLYWLCVPTLLPEVES